jgi:hypothetical protein
MTDKWLCGAKWADWTREERYFCALLFGYADNDPSRFARWVVETAKLDQLDRSLLARAVWEVGYEVCFYRDYLWERGELEGTDLPLKRTFDLCLFAPNVVIIIEAKGFEGFTSKQNAEFDEDRGRLRRLLGPEVQIYLVALASSAYVNSDRLSKKSLAPFDGAPLTWEDAAKEYPDARLKVADGLYGRKPGRIAGR